MSSDLNVFPVIGLHSGSSPFSICTTVVYVLPTHPLWTPAYTFRYTGNKRAHQQGLVTQQNANKAGVFPFHFVFSIASSSALRAVTVTAWRDLGRPFFTSIFPSNFGVYRLIAVHCWRGIRGAIKIFT